MPRAGGGGGGERERGGGGKAADVERGCTRVTTEKTKERSKHTHVGEAALFFFVVVFCGQRGGEQSDMNAAAQLVLLRP